MKNDKLHYFRIAKQLNEKHWEKLISDKLHFRGNMHSFSLVSVSQEFPEKARADYKRLKKVKVNIKNDIFRNP